MKPTNSRIIRHRIVRALSLVLALCLTGAMGLAQAENRDVFPVQPDGGMLMLGMAIKDGTLLVARNNEVYAYTPGAEEPTLLKELGQPPMYPSQDQPDRFDVLLSDKGQLYAFDLLSGRMYPAGVDSGDITLGEVITLDLSGMVQEYSGVNFLQRPEEMLVMDGFLYMITRDYERGTGNPTLLRFDLSDGKRTSFIAPNINHIAPYKDGKLLVMLYDMEDGYDRNLGRPKPAVLGVFDPAADTVQELGELDGSLGNEGNLGYDPEKDIIYSSRQGKLYRCTAQDLTKDELCGYLPSSNIWGIIAGAIIPLEEGVAVLTGDNLFIRDADPAKLPASTLTVYGEYGSPAHRRAQSMMPEVPIQMRDREYFATAQDLGQALVSGDNTMDVYILDYSFIDAESLKEKQYAQDLSGSAALSAYMDKLYPFIREAGMYDGKLLMVPVEVSIGETMVLYPERIKNAGLEVPQTFLDLVSMISEWPGERAENHPDLIPMQTENYRNDLFYLALQTFYNLRAFQGQELRYDDPVLRAMLTAVEGLDTRDLDQTVDWEAPGEAEEFFSRQPLIERSGGVNVQYFQFLHRSQAQMLALKAEEGVDAPVPVMVRVAAVNPRSKNIDLAIKYIEHYVASIPEENLVALTPDANQPILNPRFEQESQEMATALANYQASLATAEAAARTEIESMIKNLTEYMAEHAQTGQYLVTEEAILAYRAYLTHAYLSKYDPLQSGNEDMYNLYDRYLQKQIDLGTFLREADGKLRLMRLENQ